MSAIPAVLLAVAVAGVLFYAWRSRALAPVIGEVVAEPARERAAAEAELEDVKAEAVVFHAELESALEIPDERERLQALVDLAEKGRKR